MKHESFVTGMTLLAGGFGRQLEDAALEAFWIALQDLTDDEFKDAVRVALRGCKFMPAPSELRSFVREPRDLITEAATAWTAVRRAVDRVDYTVSQIDFGPHVNAVVRQLGGWDALCRATLNDLDVWKRKEFERLYTAFAGKPIGDIGRALEGPKEGKPYAAVTIGITGIPSQPQPALEPIVANGSGRKLIEALADAKDANG